MKKLLIAVQSQVIADELSRALVGQWEVSACWNCEDGKALLKQLQPDALVIELGLPQEGGFSMLAGSFPELPPSIIALTAVLNPYVEQNAARWGADYVFQIPFDLEAVKSALDEVALRKITAERVAKHLSKLGFQSRSNGYRCLIAAISRLLEEPTQKFGVEVCEYVAQSCRLSGYWDVERSIRIAINDAWERRDAGEWAQFFPLNKDGDIDRPSSKDFIRLLISILSKAP